MNIVPCPSEMEICHFANGELDEARFNDIAEHLDRCHDCSLRLSHIEDSPDKLGNLIREAISKPNQNESNQSSLRDVNTIQKGLSGTIQPLSENCDPSTAQHADHNLGQRYSPLDELGFGGIGNVMRARDNSIGRELAVKILREKHRNRPEVVQRFIEEAQIAGQLQHPGIVPIYEMGRSEDNRPFFTMKLINGETLKSVLQKAKNHRHPDSAQRQQLLNIFLQVCHAVAYAHNKGVIHRDLKPVNIMIGEFGEVQVMDWGLAKLIDHDKSASASNEKQQQSSTIATVRSNANAFESIDGTVLGTPAYMPPEQAQGKVDLMSEAADVFSLGAILLEILTGDPPYHIGSITQLVDQAIECDLHDALLKLENSQIDQSLRHLVTTCLEKNPADRPENALEVAKQVETYLRSVEMRLEQSKINEAQAKANAKHERRIRRLSLAFVALLFIAITIGGFFWFQYESAKLQQRTDNLSRLDQAVTEARSMLDSVEGFADRDDELAKGIAALNLAKELQDSPGVDANWKSKVDELAIKFEAIQSDRQLFQTLEQLQLGPNTYDFESDNYDWDQTTKQYMTLFANLGISADMTPKEDAVELLRSKPGYLLESIITAIDLWTIRTPDKTQRDYWCSIADQLDRQQSRKTVRAAVMPNNDVELKRLVSDFNPTNHTAQSAYILALQLRTKGLIDEAIQVLELSVPQYPADYLLHQLLGITLFRNQSHREEDIYRCFSVAAAIKPDAIPAQFNLLCGCINSRKYNEAIVVAQKLTETNPDLPVAFFALSDLYCRLEQFVEAEQQIDIALRLDPDNARYRSQKAFALAGQFRFAESFEHHEVAISLEPNNAECLQAYAISCLNAGVTDESLEQLEKAEQLILKAREIRPGSANVIYTHSLIINAVAHNTDSAQQKSEIYQRNVAQLSHCLELRPNWFAAELLLANTLAQLNQDEGTRAILQRVESLPRLKAYQLLLLVDTYRVLGELSKARHWLEVTLQETGISQESKFKAAQQFYMLNDYDRAESLFQSIVNLDPENEKALQLVGSLYIKTGDFKSAQNTFETIDAIRPGQTEVHKTLATIYSRLSLFIEMEQSCRRILENEPGSAKWAYNLGNALMKQNRVEDSISAYRKCLSHEPDHLSATINLAQGLFNNGQFREAQQTFRHAQSLETEQGQWQNTITQKLNQLEQIIKLENSIRESGNLDLDNKSFGTVLEIAKMFQMKKDHRNALKCYKKLINNSDNPLVALQHSLFANAARSAAAVGLDSSAHNWLGMDANATNRQFALRMLQKEIVQREQIVAAPGNEHFKRPFALMMRVWTTDPFLAPVRDSQFLNQLPADEANQWRQFWGAVESRIKELL